MIFYFYKVRRDGASRPTDTRKRPTSRERTDRTMPRTSVGGDSISARSVSRNRHRLFSFSAAVYGCTVGRAFTPAAPPILQRKRCFVFFGFAEVRRAKSPALQCKANALPPGNERLFQQSASRPFWGREVFCVRGKVILFPRASRQNPQLFAAEAAKDFYQKFCSLSVNVVQ